MKISNSLVLLLSFVLSVLLMLAPIDAWLSDIWPIWILPVMTYWIMALPHRVGIFSAWLCGLALDIFYNSLLGSHALTLLIIAALFSRIARRFSFFSTLQQILVQAFFAALYIFILIVCHAYTAQPVTLELWWPAVTTALIWPFTATLLRHYRQKFRMT